MYTFGGPLASTITPLDYCTETTRHVKKTWDENYVEKDAQPSHCLSQTQPPAHLPAECRCPSKPMQVLGINHPINHPVNL
jgi:hypothetical protein